MKVKLTIGLIFTLTVLCSCGDYFLTKNKWSDISINKTLKTKTNKTIIRTTVEKYSKSKKWFYGAIEICNQSLDTLEFNFNQSLLVDNIALQADYNLYPVSWAYQMFFVLPNSCRTWKVAWKNENPIMNFENIVVQVDTHIVVGHYPKIEKNLAKGKIVIKSFPIDKSFPYDSQKKMESEQTRLMKIYPNLKLLGYIQSDKPWILITETCFTEKEYKEILKQISKECPEARIVSCDYN